jgi:hypothetical protein
VKDLQVPADALDVHMEREDGLEAHYKHEQWHQGADRHRDNRGSRHCGASPSDEYERQQDDAHGPALPDRGSQRHVFVVASQSSNPNFVIVVLNQRPREGPAGEHGERPITIAS